MDEISKSFMKMKTSGGSKWNLEVHHALRRKNKKDHHLV